MSEPSKTEGPRARRSGGFWTGETIAAIPFVVVLAGFFVFYIYQSTSAALRSMGGGGSALFLGLVGAAFLVGHLKDRHERFYAGVQMFFGLGAIWEAVATHKHLLLEQKQHAMNVEWDQLGFLAVATLVVAEGYATWRRSRHRLPVRHDTEEDRSV